MSEQKSHSFESSSYHRPPDGERSRTPRPVAGNAGSADQQGWDAYRKWLTHAGEKPSARASTDPAVYSWKGYQSWADKVRESWKREDS